MSLLYGSRIIHITTTTIIKPFFLRDLRNAINLEEFVMRNVAFNGGCKPEFLYLDNAKQLHTLDLQGSTGMGVNEPKFLTGIYNFSPIPFSWRHLTKLGVINLRDCGFTQTQIDNLIIGLSQVIAMGLGSLSLNKVIALDGVNALPSPSVSSYIDAIETAGFTVLHSDSNGSGVVPSNSQRVLNAALQLSGTLSNGGIITSNVNVANLPQASDHNVVLTTDITPIQGLVVETNVVGNDLLAVTVKIIDGDDDVTIPTLNFKIYIS